MQDNAQIVKPPLTIPLIVRYLIMAITAVALIIVSRYDYLMFHTLVEFFATVICFFIFIIVWNSRTVTGGFISLLGIAFFFIGWITLLHVLTYKGMPFFQDLQPNLPTQLWIASRYTLGITMVAAPFLIGRRLNFTATFLSYGAAFILLVLAMLVWKVFPTCYVTGQGLTTFKIVSEYIICAMFLSSGLLLWYRRDKLDRNLFLLLVSLAISILAEICFMLYVDVYGVFNLLGHIMYFFGIYFLYRAIIVTSISRPFDVLLSSLTESRDLLKRERDRLQNLLEIEESILIALDTEGRVTMVNRKGKEILKVTDDEVLGQDWFDKFLPERMRDKSRRGFHRLVKEPSGLTKYMERPVLTADGKERIIAWNNALIFDEAGKVTGTFSSGQDITERKQAEELFKAIVDHSLVGIYIVQDGRLVLTNSQFQKYTGYTESELDSMESLNLILPEDREKVRQEAIKALKSGGDHYFAYDYRLKTKAAKVKWFMESITPIHFNGKRATLGTLVDISERKQNEELYRSLSLIDDLTGLYNRRGFLTLATKQLKLGYRLNKCLTVLYADLDHMKWINDTLGHVEGDTALVQAARMLKDAFRESDIIGRIGGDEFAVFMMGADEMYAEIILARLHDRMKAYNASSNKSYELSLSIGIHFCTSDQLCNLSEMLDRADRLMYEKKRSGR
jgi:diguanylate cyclase (GGDEF)-like protein/PAS domain S-box-containing protein